MTDSNPSKILLAEGDSNVRRSLVTLFKQVGYEVDQAVDYESAVKLMDSQTFDLAVVGERLDRGSRGFAVMRAFGAGPGRRPVVALMGTTEVEDLLAVLRLGVVDALIKPLRPDEVLSAVRQGLGQGLLPIVLPGQEGSEASAPDASAEANPQELDEEAGA